MGLFQCDRLADVRAQRAVADAALVRWQQLAQLGERALLGQCRLGGADGAIGVLQQLDFIIGEDPLSPPAALGGKRPRRWLLAGRLRWQFLVQPTLPTLPTFL